MRFGFVLAPLALLIPLATPASAAERLVSVVDFEFQPRTVTFEDDFKKRSFVRTSAVIG